MSIAALEAEASGSEVAVGTAVPQAVPVVALAAAHNAANLAAVLGQRSAELEAARAKLAAWPVKARILAEHLMGLVEQGNLLRAAAEVRLHEAEDECGAAQAESLALRNALHRAQESAARVARTESAGQRRVNLALQRTVDELTRQIDGYNDTRRAADARVVELQDQIVELERRLAVAEAGSEAGGRLAALVQQRGSAVRGRWSR